MRHPHLRADFEALEERIGGVDTLEMGTTVLTAVALLNLATQGVREVLCTIADA